ncbi:MAG: type I-E CRISPR-associated protein Cse1/CasA [Rubellimicrobium sp.]|nr:type I-E CRISPR-associated protein Cse1/CasA [Rubellimicrobium sp.]
MRDDSFNLVNNAWIPVVDKDGTRRVIAPWQMADDAILRPDWPRPDLNIACLELLIGLVFLADPPADRRDWHGRPSPDPGRLRARLAPFVPAFDLLGEGPRFMQDRARIEGDASKPDMLFIDSAGGQTVRNNADLMVWRDRYPALDPALAAMALYTLQAHAPSGGAGNRTSMRGGGPMVTLVQPEGGLWSLIRANVPYGTSATPEALPWMRPTITSEGGKQVFPAQAHPAEAFFGMPRRLRLIAENGLITGVVQRPYGTNYAGWDHPLTPYYRLKLTDEWLPKHPRAGLFGYRGWLGVIVAGEEDSGLQRRAGTLRAWHDRSGGKTARVLVAGWAMDNMKPRDFVQSSPPFVALQGMALGLLLGMIEAAEQFGLALRAALRPVLAEGEAREAVREAFHAETQAAFEAGLGELEAGAEPQQVARDWVAAMHRTAMVLFEARALPGLADRELMKKPSASGKNVKEARTQRDIVYAHRNLASAFAGYGDYGSKALGALMLPVPPKKKKEAA